MFKDKQCKSSICYASKTLLHASGTSEIHDIVMASGINERFLM
jgi:hypothetical protein